MGADFVLFLFILVAMYSLWLSGIFELCAFLIARARAPADAHTNPSDDKPLDKKADLKQAHQANIIKNPDVKPTDPKLADRKAYVLKALNLKPSDIESSVVKTSTPKLPVVKTSDLIKSKEIARADTKSTMAKPSVKPGYVKTIQMFDAIMADALLEYMKARVSKPIPVVTAAASIDDTKSASKTVDDAQAASSNIVDFIHSVPIPVDDAKVAPDAVGDAKPASSRIVDALNAISDTVDDAKAASSSAVDANTQAATHKLNTSVSSVESWDSIGSTIVEVDTSTPITSEACPRHWLAAIKLSPSDLSPAPITPTYTESADGTIYRNGHAHGVSTSTHKSTVKDLQSSIHHLRKLNASMTDDLRGALNVVAWEADTRVADLERIHQQALDRAEKRGNSRVTEKVLEEHKDVVASLEKKHKAAMADLRAEQKTTVWTLLKNHRSKMAFMEMVQKKEVALIQEAHEKKIVAIEERHQEEVATLKDSHVQDAAAVAEKDAQIATITERVASLEDEVAANVGAMQAGQDVVAALQQTITEKDAEIATVTGRLASLENEVLASIDSVNTASERAVALQKTVDEKQAEIDRILSEVVSEAESRQVEVESLQKKHTSDLAFIFSKNDKLVAAMKSDHESEIESLRSEFDSKVAAMEKKYDSHITNMEVDLTASLEALDDECDATNASHQASLNHIEVEVTGALISLNDESNSTLVFHESTINSLDGELTAAHAERNLTLASHESGLRKIETEVLTSLQSLDDESTSTIASLTANNQAAENKVVYQELVSLEPVAPECDTPKPNVCKLVFREVAAQEPAAQEPIIHESSSNELAHQELTIQEPLAQSPIIQESDEESADQSTIEDDLHYPTAGNQDFVIYCDPSPANSVGSSGTVVRHSFPFSYETSPLVAAEHYEARPSPVPAFIDHPTPFAGVWATHAALQSALSNATAVSSSPLGEGKAGSLLEAAPISETAPITTAPRRNPSPTKQKLVTKEEWKALVASLNGSGDRDHDRDLAARSAEAEARRAAELAEEARELGEEEDVLDVYETETAEPSPSRRSSDSTPLPGGGSSASPSAADLHSENAALRAQIATLNSHITALTAANAHNSAAYLSAKATAEHNSRAATEAAACLEEQSSLAAEVEAELVAASRDLEATEQRCTAATAARDAALQRADQAEKCAQHFDRLLRNVALDTLYLQRLEWSSRSQAGQVRRLLDERVPLENAVARLHNENLRLRTHAAAVQKGMDDAFAYAEDVTGGMLALLQQAAKHGVVNVATLAERTNDEVIAGLAAYMREFIDAANSNVREGRKLLVSNHDLVAAAAADRDTIDALREEIVTLKDSLADARTEVDDTTVGEQLAQAELDKVKGVVAELKAQADRVPALERRVGDLQYALNEKHVGAAPEEWQEVVEDMQMQLAAKQACLDTVTIRLTALNNVDEEHALCERREKSAEDQCEMNRRLISALAKRNHRLIEELTLTRERAGLPKGTYMIYNFTENEFGKVVLRAMLMRLADVHKYDLMEEDFAFCDELDRILDQPIEETEVQPLDREFTAAEKIMNGVLSKITTVCKDLMDGGEEIKHRGLGEKTTTDSEAAWEPLDLSIDPEDEKEADARYEAEEERRKKAAEELRAALLKADQDDQILEEESF